MNKQEAIQLMKEGKKLTHSLFTDEEYITMKNGVIIDEKRYKLDYGAFWALRANTSWDENWELFNNNKGGYNPEEGNYYPANHVDPNYDINQ